jgi:hypothetical protein
MNGGHHGGAITGFCVLKKYKMNVALYGLYTGNDFRQPISCNVAKHRGQSTKRQRGKGFARWL